MYANASEEGGTQCCSVHKWLRCEQRARNNTPHPLARADHSNGISRDSRTRGRRRRLHNRGGRTIMHLWPIITQTPGTCMHATLQVHCLRQTQTRGQTPQLGKRPWRRRQSDRRGACSTNKRRMHAQMDENGHRWRGRNLSLAAVHGWVQKVTMRLAIVPSLTPNILHAGK